MCPAVAPCGGDITGTWKLASDCGVGTGTVDEQAGCTVYVSAAVSSASGTFTFNADGTYTAEASLSENDTFTFSSACFSSGGAAGTCAQVASALGTEVMPTGPETTLSAWTCSPELEACACGVSLQVSNDTASGTYSTAGNALTATPSTATATTTGYCVQGSNLYLIPASQEVSMAGAMEVLNLGGQLLILTKE
jgi:hypothetical protein